MLPFQQISITVLLFTCSVIALAPSNTPLVATTLTSFNKNLRDYPALFTLFYSSNCKHCAGLDVVIKNLASQLHADKRFQRSVQTVLVKCNTNDQTVALCADQGVMGYPTIKFYQRNKLTKRFTSDQKRTQHSMFNFIVQHFVHTPPSVAEQPQAHEIKDYTYEVTGGELFQLIQKGTKLVLFCNRDQEACLSFQTEKWAAIARDSATTFGNNRKVDLAFVDCGLYKQLCFSYTADKSPYILLLVDGQEITRFLAQNQVIVKTQFENAIKKRLDELDEEKRKPKRSGGSTSGSGSMDEKYAIQDAKDFNTLAAPDDAGFVFVKFFAPWCGHCKKLEPSWLQMTKELNSKDASVPDNEEFVKAGIWPKVSRVDCTTDDLKELCQHQKIEGYPTLRLFFNGVKLLDFSGHRQVEFMKRWLILQIVKADPSNKEVLVGDDEVATVTEANFPKFQNMDQGAYGFLMFETPWCSYCKEMKEDWVKLAGVLKDSGMVLGTIDCTVHRPICTMQGVQGYPAINLYSYNTLRAKYTGKRNFDALLDFAKNYVTLAEPTESEDESEEQCTMDKKDDCANAEPEASETPENNEDPTENIADAEKPSAPPKVSSVLPIGALSALPAGKAAFVKFYAPWCGHCQKVAETWKLLSAVKFDETVIIAEANCDDTDDLCNKEGVKGLPTLRFYSADRQTQIDFPGSDRDLMNLAEFVEGQLALTKRSTGEAESEEHVKDEL